MLADRIALKRSQNNEEQLYKQLTKFFNRLKKEVLKALEEYWSDYQLFQGQVNLICSPVHEAHREYYEILEKYKKREYRLGVKEAERQVKNENRKHKIALKAVQTFPISSFIKKDKDALFGTLPSAERDMLNKTFTASERTLSRVDSQINQIITDGYRQGYGINQIANDLTRRFDQLSTWESKRIARTEIHGSHNTAVMDTYRDMDVEYIQWDAAGDDRTRDSHVEIDGEIIPIGSTFSNGLQFPGDTSGPIEEWINCRCSNAPFVIPYGFIAPSFSPFKESDLIPVTQETLQEPTQEQLNSNLTDEQRLEYNKLKADMKLAEDIIKSPFYTEREKSQAITSYQQNAFKLNQLKQIAHGKLAEGYANLVKNVVGTTETKEPEFKQVGAVESNNQLLGDGNYRKYSETTEHGREFDVYKFENIEIAVEKGADISIERFARHLDNLPKEMVSLSNAKRIEFCMGDVLKSEYGGTANAAGLYYSNKQQLSLYKIDKGEGIKDWILSNFDHEFSHSIDLTREGKIVYSHPEVYDKIVRLDNKFHGDELVDVFPTEYAGAGYLNYPTSGRFPERRYLEDFAESSKIYLRPTTHKEFCEKFPNRAKYLEGIYGKPKLKNVEYSDANKIVKPVQHYSKIDDVVKEYDSQLNDIDNELAKLDEARDNARQKQRACETEECAKKWSTKRRELRTERKRLNKVREEIFDERYEILKRKYK